MPESATSPPRAENGLPLRLLSLHHLGFNRAIWIYDTRSPEVIAAARRDAAAIRDLPDEAATMEWIESVSVLDDPDDS